MIYNTLITHKYKLESQTYFNWLNNNNNKYTTDKISTFISVVFLSSLSTLTRTIEHIGDSQSSSP